jgi:anti-sigma factor RsiW
MEHVQEHFSDYWEKGLDEATRRRVEEHLSACPSCREEYAAFERAMAPLGALHRLPAPPRMQETVPGIIRRRSRGRFFAPRSLGERIPWEWISLGMLGLLAAIYVLLKLAQPMILMK